MDWDWMVKPDDQVYCEERWWEYTNKYIEWTGYWCLNAEFNTYCYMDELKNRECWPGVDEKLNNEMEKYCDENSWYIWEDYRGNPICFLKVNLSVIKMISI